MNSETLEALKGSIGKWEAIVAGTGFDNGVDNCPLCGLFNNDETNDSETDCDGCPVAEKSGHKYCGGTPYTQFLRWGIKAAQEELDFLRSLLPAGA